MGFVGAGWIGLICLVSGKKMGVGWAREGVVVIGKGRVENGDFC